MADLVRHDALVREFLALRLGTLEHLHDGALGILEGDHVGNRGLRILQAPYLDVVPGGLLLEGVEVIVGGKLKADAYAACRTAFAKHDGVMVNGGGEVGRVLLLRYQIQAEDVGVDSTC